MKRLLILVIFFFKSFVSHGETKFNLFFFKESFGDTTVKINLPFGSPILISHKFPKHWDYDPDHPSSPNLIAYEKLTAFLNHLNTLKPTSLLRPTKIKKIPIGDDNLITEDKSKFISQVTYQLPDFGPYKCYYQYDDRNLEGLKSKDFKNYLEIGNLILYNQKTRQANILKIYTSYEVHDSLAEYARFFYISKNEVISIYDCWVGEMEGYMKKTQTITVDSAGKIIITNLK